MLGIVMQNVIMPRDLILGVVMICIIIQSVVMLSVVMLSVESPGAYPGWTFCQFQSSLDALEALNNGSAT
jgi:hypothetical protein